MAGKNRKRKSSVAEQESVRLIKGAIPGEILEAALWDVAWAECSDVENKTAKYSWAKLSTESKNYVKDISDILIDKGVQFNSVALEVMEQGGYIKAAKLNKNWVYPMALVSLGQYRGGKMRIGTYSGYINPGEIIVADSPDKSPLTYEVAEVSSGTRVVLIFYLERRHEFHDPVY